jgi:chromosome segregation ATPase
VQRPKPQPAPSLQRSGITVDQLRNELRKYAAQQPANAAAAPAAAPAAKPVIKHVQDPKLLQERTQLQRQLEDLTNDLQQSAVTIDALNRRNEGLAQSLQERDQLLGHLERQVLGANPYS